MPEVTTSTAEPQGDPGPTNPSPEPTEPASEPQAPELDPNRTYSAHDMREVREEAKRYRHRLRDTEQRVTALQERVDRHDRAAVERIAGERLNDASDVWLVHDVADFRGEDGALDETKVTSALDEIATTRQHWLKPQESWNGGVRRPVKQEPSFGQALKNAVGGGG
jgi:hypothetical protein